MVDVKISFSKFLNPSMFFEGNAINSIWDVKKLEIFESFKFSIEMMYGSMFKFLKVAIFSGDVVEPFTW